MLLVVTPLSLVTVPRGECQHPLSVFLALHPLSCVLIAAVVTEIAIAIFQIGLPVARVIRAISVPIGALALFAAVDQLPLELMISERVYPLSGAEYECTLAVEGVALPIPVIHVPISCNEMSTPSERSRYLARFADRSPIRLHTFLHPRTSVPAPVA
jgi:hypothetical protein